MPRIAIPLTATQIRQTKPKNEKEIALCDGDGLYLRIKPSGVKAWIFNYMRPATGKRANLSLGSYPAVSLASARQRRQEMHALLGQGLDPGTHRAEQKRLTRLAQANTFRHVADAWLSVKRSKVTPDYAEDIERSLDKHLYPSLGKLPIHQVNAPDVIAELKPLAARGALETVKRLCQRLNEIMEFALISGYIPHNPIGGIGRAFEAPRKQNLPSLHPSELPEFLKRLTNANLKVSTRCLIEWQLHTMTRPAEAAGARWSEIDLEKKRWTLPAERMKKRKPHVIPLSPQALAILERMQPISGHREFVFPGDRNPRTHLNSQTANMAIKRMGYKQLLVAHGLRSVASTILNEQGFDPDLIEVALAHVDRNEVRATYNRADYLKSREAMMCWWSDHIDDARAGRVSAPSHKHLRVMK